MTGRGRVARLGLASALLALLACGPAAPRPDIVLIVSDDAGFADFSFQGDPSFPTPHIDSLAAEGVRFDSAYVAASLCGPSRAALMTGRYPQRFGFEHNLTHRSGRLGLDADELLLPAALAGQGYRTGCFGKWHLGVRAPFRPVQRGCEEFFGFYGGARSYYPSRGGPRTLYRELMEGEERVSPAFDYLTEELGARAAAFASAAERPYFLLLSFSAVHTPMDPPPGGPPCDEEQPEGCRDTLRAMTVAMDDAVGEVLAALDARGTADETLVVFLNDNGGAVGNHSSNAPLRGGKGTFFEGGIRVPLLARWPDGLPGGVVYPEMVSALDLFPTLLAAAGGRAEAVERPLDGVDLLPFVRGEQSGLPHQALFWRRGANRQLAVRAGDWKLVLDRDQVARGEPVPPLLFDLARDPGERTDLARGPERRRLAGLMARYRAWEAEMIEPHWYPGMIDVRQAVRQGGGAEAPDGGEALPRP